MQGKSTEPLSRVGTDRRRFMKGVAAAGGAAALAAGLQPAAASTADQQAGKSGRGSGYHETDHIRDYYKTAAL